MKFHIEYDDPIETLFQELTTIDNPEKQEELQDKISKLRKEINQKERVERRLEREYRNRLRSNRNN